MLRKYFSILFLVAAQLLVLGHGILPHQHHTDSIIEESDHHENGEHEHSDQTPLELALSGFIHVGQQICFTNSGETRIVVSKDTVTPSEALRTEFSPPVKYIVAHQKHTFPPDRHLIYSPPLHDGAYTLRGPPLFIVA